MIFALSFIFLLSNALAVASEAAPKPILPSIAFEQAFSEAKRLVEMYCRETQLCPALDALCAAAWPCPLNRISTISYLWSLAADDNCYHRYAAQRCLLTLCQREPAVFAQQIPVLTENLRSYDTKFNLFALRLISTLATDTYILVCINILRQLTPLTKKNTALWIGRLGAIGLTSSRAAQESYAVLTELAELMPEMREIIAFNQQELKERYPFISPTAESQDSSPMSATSSCTFGEGRSPSSRLP